MSAVGKSSDMTRTSKQRRFIKLKSGLSLFRKTGRWSHVEQVVDRRNDVYVKKIKASREFNDVEDFLADLKN